MLETFPTISTLFSRTSRVKGEAMRHMGTGGQRVAGQWHTDTPGAPMCMVIPTDLYWHPSLVPYCELMEPSETSHNRTKLVSSCPWRLPPRAGPILQWLGSPWTSPPNLVPQRLKVQFP